MLYFDMEHMGEEELVQLRGEVGKSFEIVTRWVENAHFENDATKWVCFGGMPFMVSNRFLMYANEESELARLEKYLQQKSLPASAMMTGKAKEMKIGSFWTRQAASSPFMAYKMEDLSMEEAESRRDERVYEVTAKDYERVTDILTTAFTVPEETRHLSPFAQTAKHVEEMPEVKIFAIDEPEEASGEAAGAEIESEKNANGNTAQQSNMSSSKKEKRIASIVFSVYVGENVSLLAMGTIPEARRKGFAKAVLNASLIDAKAHNCRYALLFASQVGKLLYNSAGFVTLEEWDFYCSSDAKPPC